MLPTNAPRFSKRQNNIILWVVAIGGLIPAGALALWAFGTSADLYENLLEDEYVHCPLIADCRLPLQCRVNAAIVKEKYLSELDGPYHTMFRLAGYPTISVGYPQGTEDKFLIPTCEPLQR